MAAVAAPMRNNADVAAAAAPTRNEVDAAAVAAPTGLKVGVAAAVVLTRNTASAVAGSNTANSKPRLIPDHCALGAVVRIREYGIENVWNVDFTWLLVQVFFVLIHIVKILGL